MSLFCKVIQRDDLSQKFQRRDLKMYRACLKMLRGSNYVTKMVLNCWVPFLSIFLTTRSYIHGHSIDIVNHHHLMMIMKSIASGDKAATGSCSPRSKALKTGPWTPRVSRKRYVRALWSPSWRENGMQYLILQKLNDQNEFACKILVHKND